MPDVLPLPDMSDPMEVGMEIVRLRSESQMQQQRLTEGMGNVTNTMASVQAEVRRFGEKLGELADRQNETKAQSAAIENLAKSIDKHIADYSTWRAAHEEKNEGVANSVTGARSVIRFLAWAGGFVIVLIVFTVQLQFNAGAADRLRIEAQANKTAERLDRRMDRFDALMDAQDKDHK